MDKAYITKLLDECTSWQKNYSKLEDFTPRFNEIIEEIYLIKQKAKIETVKDMMSCSNYGYAFLEGVENYIEENNIKI